MEKPYVFISYAHRDSEVVLSCVNAMKKSGITIWYDEGSEPISIQDADVQAILSNISASVPAEEAPAAENTTGEAQEEVPAGDNAGSDSEIDITATETNN